MTKTYIYGLKDPCTGELKYIGKSNNPQRRLKDHIIDGRGEYRKAMWIRELKTKGLCPVLEIIEQVNMEEWRVKETELIAKHRETLLNIKEGGNGLSEANSTSFKAGGIPWNKGLTSSK